jgi:apolipoprotein N-acyltransferase
LINLTNDAWFGDTTEPWIHLALSQLRAVEHRRYLVRANNSGVSAIIDPVGRVVSHTDTFQPQVLSGEIAWLRSSTLYEWWGNLPWWVTSALACALAFVRRRTSAENRSVPLASGAEPPPPPNN